MLHIPDDHTARLLALADFLDELEPERFSLRQWGSIKEPRCICGWFMHLRGRMDKDNWQDAGELLGMSEDIAAKFFQQPLRRATDVTNYEAAKALRHYAVTGEFKGW